MFVCMAVYACTCMGLCVWVCVMCLCVLCVCCVVCVCVVYVCACVLISVVFGLSSPQVILGVTNPKHWTICCASSNWRPHLLANGAGEEIRECVCV